MLWTKAKKRDISFSSVISLYYLEIRIERRSVNILKFMIKDTGEGTDSYVGTFPVIFSDPRSCFLEYPASTDGNRVSLKY